MTSNTAIYYDPNPEKTVIPEDQVNYCEFIEHGISTNQERESTVFSLLIG